MLKLLGSVSALNNALFWRPDRKLTPATESSLAGRFLALKKGTCDVLSGHTQCVSSVIREAQHASRSKGISTGIAWDTGRTLWIVYDLLEGTLPGQEPELVCFPNSSTVLPLTSIAIDVLESLACQTVNPPMAA